jgi:hypothetical protein
VLNYLGAAAYDGGLVITSAGGRGDELPPDLLYWQSLGPQEPGTLLIGSMTVPPISAPDIRPFWQNIPVGATPVGTLSIGESAVDQPVPYLEQYLQYLNTEPQRSNLEWSGPPIVPAQGNNPVEGPQIIERGEPPIIGKQSNNPGWGGQPLVGTQGNNLEWSGPPNISTRGSNLEWSGPPSITAPGGNMEWSGPPADVFSTGTKPIGYIDLGTLQPAIPSPPNLSPAASSGPAKSELPLYLGERSFAPSVEVVCRTFCTGHRLHNGADEFFWHAR